MRCNILRGSYSLQRDDGRIPGTIQICRGWRYKHRGCPSPRIFDASSGCGNAENSNISKPSLVRLRAFGECCPRCLFALCLQQTASYCGSSRPVISLVSGEINGQASNWRSNWFYHKVLAFLPAAAANIRRSIHTLLRSIALLALGKVCQKRPR